MYLITLKYHNYKVYNYLWKGQPVVKHAAFFMHLKKTV